MITKFRNIKGEEWPKHTLKILLAEDNLINRKFMIDLLGKRGHSVLPAADGQEALKILESQFVDLAFMDIQMPVMDGFEATGIIRQREKSTGAHLPIIAMTAHALKGDRERCLEAGMDSYISKPVKISELYKIIRQAIPEKTGLKGKQAPDILPTGPEINLDLLLEAFNNDLEWFKEIFTLFAEKYPHQIKTMQGAIEDNDSNQLKKVAHSFKGSVSLFKAPEINELAFKLEVMGKERKLQGAKAALSELESLMNGLIANVKTILQKESSCIKV